MRYYYSGAFASTLVVEIPSGWLVTHQMYASDGTSAHSVVVPDELHTTPPKDFANPGEKEQP